MKSTAYFIIFFGQLLEHKSTFPTLDNDERVRGGLEGPI